MSNNFKDRRIFISGGTGSWGNELTKQLLNLGVKEICIYSRGEFAQFTMKQKFNDDRLRFIIGDVRDLNQLNYAMKGVDIVVHLAAMKHIPVCELYPSETIKTNIHGVENIISAAITQGVKKVINVSSDKATYPLNVYGMTKAIGEKLIVNANKLSDTQFVCVRGGNVLGSNGSVVPVFIDSIKKEKMIKITDKRMTRFFLSLPEAIKLLLVAADTTIIGGIFVMKMPSCKITDLARVLIHEFAPNEHVHIEETGIRPGEKIHETLVNPSEAMLTYEYNENYYVIAPNSVNLPKIGIKEYTSNDKLLDDKDIRELLIKGEFI